MKLKSSIKRNFKKAGVYITIGAIILNMNRLPAIREEKFVLKTTNKIERLAPNPNEKENNITHIKLTQNRFANTPARSTNKGRSLILKKI